MKNLAALVLVLAFSGAAMADANLIGEWNSNRSRACLSGATPDPSAFNPEGKMAFTASEMTVTMTDSGCTMVLGPIAITVQNGKVTPKSKEASYVLTCDDGTVTRSDDATVDEYSYVINGDQLTMTTAPSKFPGACPMGDSEIFKFDRVK